MSGTLSSGYLTSDRCEALLKHPSGLFWSMFGAHPPTLREQGGKACWGGAGEDADRYWRDAVNGGDGRSNAGELRRRSEQGCNTNWIRGSRGLPGQPSSRWLNGPALLGLDADIYAFCAQELGLPIPPTDFLWGEDQKL
jgi:hypothetical protein